MSSESSLTAVTFVRRVPARRILTVSIQKFFPRTISLTPLRLHLRTTSWYGGNCKLPKLRLRTAILSLGVRVGVDESAENLATTFKASSSLPRAAHAYATQIASTASVIVHADCGSNRVWAVRLESSTHCVATGALSNLYSNPSNRESLDVFRSTFIFCTTLRLGGVAWM